MEKDREYEKEGGKEGRERVKISGEEEKKKRGKQTKSSGREEMFQVQRI